MGNWRRATLERLLRDVSLDNPVVLLVEGDIVARFPLAQYLRQCGFTVVEAANGEEAKAL